MSILAVFAAFAVAVLITGRLCDPAMGLQILDHPNDRSLHTQPTPRTGGLAVVAGIMTGLLLLHVSYPATLNAMYLLVLGAILLAIVSFLDDRFGVPAAIRIVVHFAVASMLLWGGHTPAMLELPGWTWDPPLPLETLILLLFVMWMINLYNFMDGMDGFAGGMAVIGFGTFAILGLKADDALFASASLLVSAAAAGFLVFNFPPAKIFLGDTGSSILGYLAAAFSLWGSHQQVFPLWIGILIFSPFIVDASITLCRRLVRGEKIWKPHRTHYYQRLVQAGLGHRRTVLAEYLLMLLCSLSALYAMAMSAKDQITLICGWILFYTLLAIAIDTIERLGIEWIASLKALSYRLRNRTAALVHDLLMVPVAWLGAYWLRFNLENIPTVFWYKALALLPLVIVIHGAMFLRFGLYRGIWRFASMPDFIRILKAVLAAVAIFSILILLITQMEGVPRSVFILHGLLLLMLLGFPRFFYRWIKDHRLYYRPGARVLIVGAGRAGEMLARDLTSNPDGDYQPVAFVDDDPRKQGTEVRGVRVAAPCKHIPQLVLPYQIDLVFLAIPSASARQMRRIVGYCEESGRPFRTLPRLQDLLSGRATLQELRDVSIEDLLGRAPVSLDWETIRQKLSGRKVLISGGGGSIGSELCRQVAGLRPASLIILDQSEFNLYRIDMELRGRFPKLALNAHLGDLCDRPFVDHFVDTYQPDVVFHAAAYKHVPLLEFHAREAIRNNLFGTINLATAADRFGCQTFVLISTDKAVKPTNMLGASKQLAEVYCQNFNHRSTTRFVIVRFGNVLGSAGSVVPLFRRQIQAGGPVTVTDPRVSRYFMTIPEASQLIMQAGAVGEGGEIYVLDMGEPINISYLAEQMIRLSGKELGKDIAIEFMGLRPGDKLTEELFHESEDLMPTPYPKLLLAQHRQINWPDFFNAVGALQQACADYDEDRVRHLVKQLVPGLQGTGSDPDCHIRPHRIALG